jgi:hypothetical protein
VASGLLVALLAVVLVVLPPVGRNLFHARPELTAAPVAAADWPSPAATS